MSGRINFIEKGKFVLTYKKMLLIGAAWFGFCFVIFLFIGGYSWFVNKRVEKLKHTLNGLNIKKEETMALIDATKSQPAKTNVKQLSEIYSNFPVWSDVMSHLSKSMPPQTWLKSVSTDFSGESGAARKIEINGMGQNMNAIAKFIGELNKNPVFRNAVLSKSARTEEDKKQGYSFIILSEVVFREKKWN